MEEERLCVQGELPLCGDSRSGMNEELFAKSTYEHLSAELSVSRAFRLEFCFIAQRKIHFIPEINSILLSFFFYLSLLRSFRRKIFS